MTIMRTTTGLKTLRDFYLSAVEIAHTQHTYKAKSNNNPKTTKREK